MNRSIDKCHRKILLSLALFVALALVCGSGAAEVKTLQNDSWMDMTAAGFQGGFVFDEIGSAVFVPELSDYPIRLKKVQLLFGGDQEGVTRDMVFMVWKDVGTDAPGEVLYEEELEFQASSQAFTEIDISGTAITLSEGNVRVGLKFKHNGFPGIARDDDSGSSNDFPSRNHIFAAGIGWVKSSDLGVLGDWIMRLEVETSGGGTSNMSNTTTSNTTTSNTTTSNTTTSNTTTSNTTVEGDDLAISVINPYNVNEGEETTVTVLGKGFEAGVNVRIGATPLSQIIVQSSEALIGTVPDTLSAGVYDVTVNLGSEQVVLNQGFEVVAVDPVAQPASDGCSVSNVPVHQPILPALALLATGALALFRRRG